MPGAMLGTRNRVVNETHPVATFMEQSHNYTIATVQNEGKVQGTFLSAGVARKSFLKK